MDWLLEHGATALKEPAPEAKQSKKGGAAGKKKQADRTSAKRYILTKYKDGIWAPLSSEEMLEFLSKNASVAEYLKKPEMLGSLVIPPVSSAAPIYDHWDKAAKRIIGHMWKLGGAWHFHQPVDPDYLKIPDYPQIIKEPMDFGTIKQKLAGSAYGKCQEFVHDMELVFRNCIEYNGEASEFGILAKNLREEFHKQCQLLSLDFYQ